MTEMSELVRTDDTVPPGWIQMASGKGVDLARPSAGVVDFNDIAVHLSRIARFTGASRVSVAQHSCLVAVILPPRLQLYGLLHDAHEAYLGDDSTPKKNLIHAVSPALGEVIADLKRRWDLAIWEAARISPPSAMDAALIRDADYHALAIERRDTMAPAADDMTRKAWVWAWLPEPIATVSITPCSPKKAEALFLRCLKSLLWGDAGGCA